MCNTSILKQFHRVNDRLSFKKLFGISFNRPSPNHSTFSRF
ncbi:MAG: hypothetical protein DRH90_22050, partial [Deltaproteobacteria bacterium]